MGRFLDIAEEILKRHKRPMRLREIVDFADAHRFLEFSEGETPSQTMKAKICVDIRKKGRQSRFKRCGPGLFALRSDDNGHEEYLAKPFEQKIKTSEEVLVFPTELLHKIGYFNGVKKDYKPYIKQLLSPKVTKFIPRLKAGRDKRYKQVVSYVLIIRKNRVLRFVRGKHVRSLDFLHGRFCIGFGGHAQRADYENYQLFAQEDSGYEFSVQRELEEELHLPKHSISEKNFQICGILNDDSSPEGRAHFAIIQRLNLDHIESNLSARKLKKEKAINELTFVPIKDLGKDFERYEYWSKLCIEAFYNKKITVISSVKNNHRFKLKRKSMHIAIVGSIGNGKTEACSILQKNYGYRFISTRKIVQDLMGGSKLEELGRKNFQAAALEFIANKAAKRKLAEAIYEEMQKNNKGLCVIDGIRSVGTYEWLKKLLKGELALIYVDSTPDHAFKFRNAIAKDKISIKDYLEYITHPVESEIESFFPISDIIFFNYGPKKSYYEAIRNYFSKELW